jgi:hypothetical protein
MARTAVWVGCLLVLSILCTVATGGTGESDEYEAGDEWTYDLEMTMDTIMLSGSATYSFEGLSKKSVAGYSYDTYEMKGHGTMTISGEIEGFSVGGTATLNGIDSIDRENLDVVVSDSNLSMTISTTVNGSPMSMQFWEHGVNTYSPPGGVGEEPANPKEGVSWTMSRTLHSETMTSEDGIITTDSASYSETITYTYMGEKSITVPAGTFKCDVIQEDDGDSITTSWYNAKVGAEVKSVYQSGSSESGTMVLKSFRYTPSSSGGFPLSMALVSAGFAVAVVVVVVVIWILLKRRPKSQAPQVNPISPGPGPPPPPAG